MRKTLREAPKRGADPVATVGAPDVSDSGSPTPAPEPDRKRWVGPVITLLKGALSVLLIAFLIQNVDWPAMRAQLALARPFWIAVAFAIWLGQYVINALKWQAAMNVHGLRYPLPFLIRVYLISSFFTNFFPSSIGGDGYRILRSLPEEGRSRAVSAVVLERLIGVMSLLTLGFVGASYVAVSRELPIAWLYVTAGLVGALVLMLILALLRSRLVGAIWTRLRSNSRIDGLAMNLDQIRGDPMGVARVFFFSLLFQSFAILAIWLIAQHGLDVPFTVPETAMTTALAELAAALPFSLNGLGLMEGAFTYVGTELGIPFDSGLLVAVTLRLLLVPLGVICGLVYVLELVSGRNGDRPELGR